MIKKILLLLIVPAVLMIPSCNTQDIIARMYGEIGRTPNEVFVDIGFDRFVYDSLGEGSSMQIQLTFDNLSGEFMAFTVSPTNEDGSSVESMFGTGSYNIDGASNKFDGLVMVGQASQSFNATSGTVKISVFDVDDGYLTQLEGEFSVRLSPSGWLEGTFQHIASGE
jgi:hypothetical protein